MIVSESEVQAAFTSFLRDEGFVVREEVRYCGKRFDVVASLDGVFFGFEVKLHNWKRALRQLRAYQLCCDRVFLVKFGSANEKLKSECALLGVGLYVVSHKGASPVRIAKSKRSSSWSSHFSSTLKRAFEV